MIQLGTDPFCIIFMMVEIKALFRRILGGVV